MKVEKITGTSSSVKIKTDKILAVFEGEMLVNGFLASKSAVKVYSEDNQEMQISSEEKETLIKEAKKFAIKNNYNLEFE